MDDEVDKQMVKIEEAEYVGWRGAIYKRERTCGVVSGNI